MRQPSRRDPDLGGAEHVAGGMEAHIRVADAELLAIADRLRAAGEIGAVAQPHQVERLRRREHRAMARPRMVGMAVGDQRPLDRAHGIDVEAAAPGVEAGRRRTQKFLGAHVWKIWHRAAIARPRS